MEFPIDYQAIQNFELNIPDEALICVFVIVAFSIVAIVTDSRRPHRRNDGEERNNNRFKN